MVDQRYRLRVFGIAVALAAGYVLVLSESGVLERMALEERRQERAGRIAELRREHQRLGTLRERYRDGYQTAQDVHRAGMIERGGTALMVKGLDQERVDPPPAVGEESSMLLPILRILWLAVSAAVIAAMVYLFRNQPISDRGAIEDM